MKHSMKITHPTLVVLLLAALVPAHAQIPVGGIADKGVYSDQATFTITNQAGYTYHARLDGNPTSVGAPVVVRSVDYHELLVFRTNTTTSAITNMLLRFVVAASVRNGSECGLPAWTPNPAIASAPEEFAGAHLRLVTPQAFPAGFEIPVVAWVENDQGHAIRVNGELAAPGHPSFAIRRGVGSGFLSSTNSAGTLTYVAEVGGLQVQRAIEMEANTTWTSVSGTLAGNTTWPANSRILVSGHLTNNAGSTLTIGAGTIVRVGASVDVYNSGNVIINGTTEQPVVFMPANPGQLWGGFVQHAGNTAFAATGAIFTGSGANQGCWFTGHSTGCSTSLSGIGSHRGEQALFSLKGANCALSLTDCAAISLAGQFGHSAAGVSGSYPITLTRFLMQRCTTGGEYTDAAFTVNDSAFIECPDSTWDFVDGDNDALYIVNGNHSFNYSLWGWTKDDGVDSGGSGAGVLNFQHCWFESIFHEGNSLSGTGKIVTHTDGVFIDCGQGLESGYEGPTGNLVHCLALGNLAGGRFGDNYTSGYSYSGFFRATNSIVINNHRDIWGFNFQDWTYRTSAMDVQSNLFSVPNPLHPNNTVWQPAADAGRLSAFLTVPPDAPVGVGLAVRASRFDLSALASPLPVRLSTFSTNTVSVGYRLETSGTILATGTLVFEPGETIKSIPSLAGLLPADTDLVRVQLVTPVNARITGAAIAWFARNAVIVNSTLVSTGAVWKYLDTGTNAGTVWREPGYDDSAWRSGPAELGYGDGGEATVIGYGPNSSSKYTTYYFRRNFTVDAPADWSGLTVRLRRDDGGIVYLNGTEVFRSNITNGIVTYTTFASEALDDGTLFFSTNVPASLLVAGTNLLAVEIHQNTLTSSDISFDLQLEAVPVPAVRTLRFGPDWYLSWDDATALLEQAEDLAGPWSTVSAAAPVLMDARDGRKFYRLRK